jgi:hypothetical protein
MLVIPLKLIQGAPRTRSTALTTIISRGVARRPVTCRCAVAVAAAARLPVACLRLRSTPLCCPRARPPLAAHASLAPSLSSPPLPRPQALVPSSSCRPTPARRACRRRTLPVRSRGTTSGRRLRRPLTRARSLCVLAACDVVLRLGHRPLDHSFHQHPRRPLRARGEPRRVGFYCNASRRLAPGSSSLRLSCRRPHRPLRRRPGQEALRLLCRFGRTLSGPSPPPPRREWRQASRGEAAAPRLATPPAG